MSAVPHSRVSRLRAQARKIKPGRLVAVVIVGVMLVRGTIDTGRDFVEGVRYVASIVAGCR